MRTHEQRTEAFYSRGVENYGTFHSNYLNFGLWEDGITDYVAAAERLLTRLAEKIRLGRQSRLLDVACGMGTQDLFFMRRFGCERIDAVDLTAKHIAVATARNMFANVTYRVGDACSLPFSDGQFTHVISIEGVVHFNPRERFLREAHRVLEHGGELGMSDFCLGRPPRSAFERLLIRACERAWHVPVANAETVETYTATMERAGLTDVHIEVVSDEVIPGYLAEQARPDVRAAQCRIRGPVAGRLGLVIDWLVRKAYDAGLLAYILATGRKEGAHGDSSGSGHRRDGRDAPSRRL